MQPPYLSKQTLSTKDGASLVSPASGNRHGCLAIPLSLPPSLPPFCALLSPFFEPALSPALSHLTPFLLLTLIFHFSTLLLIIRYRTGPASTTGDAAVAQDKSCPGDFRIPGKR